MERKDTSGSIVNDQEFSTVDVREATEKKIAELKVEAQKIYDMDLLSFQKGELLAPIYEELEGLLIKPREQLA